MDEISNKNMMMSVMSLISRGDFQGGALSYYRMCSGQVAAGLVTIR